MTMNPENLIDVAATLRQVAHHGPIWSVNSEQLNVNLVRLPTGDAVAEHVNREVDVLLVVFEGAGELIIAGEQYPLGPGRAVVIPIGVARAIQCTVGPLVYLLCHRRRAGLMPTWPNDQ
jgi:quercetin dioxygenase-like cupin family protein